jgi:hypothetical protein
MTKKSNKKMHKEIKDRLFEPKTEEDHKNMEEIIYGDENNPGGRFHTGDDWNLKPTKKPKK